MKKLTLILLAAGSSKRFGGEKLMYPIGSMPMVGHILSVLMDLSSNNGWELIAVSRPSAAADYIAGRGVKTVINHESETGISSSIRAGLNAAGNAENAAFFVADQPYLTAATAETFLRAYLASGNIAGCVAHEGVMGNPAAFSARLFGELMALDGDRGGKAVIRRHTDDLFIYEVSDPKELSDIDILENAL